MNSIKYVGSLLLMFTLMSGCGEDQPEQLTLPSDLEVSITNETGKGKVTVTAHAKNANFYTIFYGVSLGESGSKSNDGKGEYTYTSARVYTIRVQAHATVAAFISESKEVTITLPAENNNGEIVIPATGYSTPESYSGMKLVWQDEFNGTDLNTADWTFETGGHGWGNEELQYYKKENTSLQDGSLIITAKKETVGSNNYTSSRIITKDKKSFKYGRIDVRAALPKGQGIWPAIWMLGSNISTVDWPACGEIDIMEMIGGSGRENTVHGTVHWDNNGNYANYGKPHSLASGTYGDEFHVFSIVWTATSITWYVDDVQFNVVSTTPEALSEFQNNFFVILNVAVGGKWPQNPDSSSTYPQHMIVDYVRVFQ